MKFAQLRAEHRVLEIRQDLVAHPFVERHAAVERILLVDHARAEDRIGVFVDERLEQDGQLFRRVLAVAMDQGDDVEAVVDRVAVAELLVAAVALVLRRAQDRDPEIAFVGSRASGRSGTCDPSRSRR